MTDGSRYTAMLSMIPEGRLGVLDYGCGGGHFAAELAVAGHDVLAIDSDARSLGAAREAWSEVVQRHGLEFWCAPGLVEQVCENRHAAVMDR